MTVSLGVTELGREAGTLHRGIGEFAAGQGIDAVSGIRGAACRIAPRSFSIRPKDGRSGK
jgi:hypothetical protein